MTTSVCVHHWSLEPDQVSNVHGYCLRCGADRLFAGTLAEDAKHVFRQSIRAPKDRVAGEFTGWNR